MDGKIDKKSYSTLASTEIISKTEDSKKSGSKIDRWLIKPLLPIANKVNSIVLCSLDVETIKFNNNNQIPIAISFAYL